MDKAKRRERKLSRETYGDFVPLHKQLRKRIKRITKHFGIYLTRICKESYTNPGRVYEFLRYDKQIMSGPYDRLCQVCCHYEFLMRMEKQAERARWRERRKRKRAKEREVD